jgi:hypothetical protein
VGYFHTIIWFKEYPWVLTISFTFLENIRLHTWDPVSMQLTGYSVWVFQKRMHLSAVPPPDASNPFWWGLQPIAFTAAVWSENFTNGCSPCYRLHTISLLSLPPEASCDSSKDHLRPQTSCLWPTSFWKNWFEALRSLWRMFRSLDPVLTIDPFQATVPTLLKWPETVLTNLQCMVSQIWVSPLLVPTARCDPLWLHPTDVIESSAGTSQSLVTLLVHALQMYTALPKPTASTFVDDQSTRLR